MVAAQLGNLALRARRILDGLYSGHHVNRHRGHSQDFSEHRAYNPGDDPRGLDWKIFGRTDRLVIKQFEEQTNFSANILLDDSASMNFSWGGRVTKLEYAKSLAAAMGYLLSAQHDAVGLITRSTRLPPSSQRGHLESYFEALQSVTASGVWDVGNSAAQLGSALKRRGFVLVFSDLLNQPERVFSAVRALHARKQEVIVFHLFDPAERDLPFEGPTLFEDMETNEVLRTDPDAVREHYRSFVAQRLATFEHVMRSSGVDYLFLTTDTPFDKGLGAFLSWREARS